MRQKHYTDDTPSREVEEEDWETLHDTEHKRSTVTVVQIRDKLDQLADLISVCAMALDNACRKESVGIVLLTFVRDAIKVLQQDLKTL